MPEKISMQNNPIAHAKRRYWILERRLRRISNYRRTHIEYESGMAARMYINTDPKVLKAGRLRGIIRDEQRKIEKFIHRNGYTLA